MAVCNSFKRKHLTGGCFPFQRFSAFSTWWETWQTSGRHMLEKKLRILHPGLKAAGRQEKSLGLAWASEMLKNNPNDILSPTSPHFIILLSNATPWGLNIQIYELMKSYFKHHRDRVFLVKLQPSSRSSNEILLLKPEDALHNEFPSMYNIIYNI